MTTPKRMPKEGERVRVLTFADADVDELAWGWADVTETDGGGFYCTTAMNNWQLYRMPSDYPKIWRFPEDDPEVCGERPAYKDKP